MLRCAFALLCATTVLGFNVPASRCSRRGAIVGGMLAVLPPSASFASTRADLLGGQGQGCTFGDGSGCDALAEGNELILKLQKKSRDNKEKYELELYEKTTAMLGYDDYLMAADKVMVRINASGKYQSLTLPEYYDAKKAGRLSPGDNGIENLDFVAPPREAATRSASDLSLDSVRALVLADKVDGVVFQGPSGMSALAIEKGSDAVLKLVFDKTWKREAFFNLCEKRGVPNNLKDVLAAQ